MSISYGNMHVDERYAGIIEPNLYIGTPLVPNVSYTDKFQIGPAGQIFVHKLTDSTTGRLTASGSDLPTGADSGDSLIAIALNNCFQANEKIYQVASDAVEIELANERLANAVRVVRKIREQSALACLITEGTASSETTALTASNIKKYLLAERTTLSSAGATPDVVLCSPAVYSLILESAGTQFTPEVNDRMVNDGRVGSWLGFTFLECTAMATGADIKYYNYSGTLTTVAAATLAKVDFIMYNHEAFSVIDNADAMRIVDSEAFVGALAQVEINTGFRVTTSACVSVRKHA